MELWHHGIIGQGIPLIILHGLYGSSDNWLTIARRLSGKYAVIVPDMRNHGRSPHHPVHTYPAMCADILELADSLSIEKYILLGHSMGGKTAMHIAAQAPQRVLKLVVADIAPVNYSSLTDYSPLAIAHLNLMHCLLHTDTASFARREDIARYWAADIADAGIRQFMLKNLQRNGPGFSWRINLSAIARNLPHILNGTDDFSSENHPVVQTPTLFVKGENSSYLSPEIFPQIQTIFPQAQMTSIPNAGHWLHADQPELFLKQISRWLNVP
jgi:pimeloyl-ACP methyl ester carboxylesterase